MSNETCRLITKEQLDKYKQLEKQLDIATKTLKKISVSLWDEMACRDCAQKALKEMEVE